MVERNTVIWGLTVMALKENVAAVLYVLVRVGFVPFGIGVVLIVVAVVLLVGLFAPIEVVVLFVVVVVKGFFVADALHATEKAQLELTKLNPPHQCNHIKHETAEEKQHVLVMQQQRPTFRATVKC